MSVLGVVPARGGSKGLPRKNLVPLGGEPLLVHTLRAAKGAKTLDRLIVSTDDDEIAAVAREHDVEVVRRPAELAGDESPTEDALIHAVESLGEPYPDYVVTLEPTSPLRSAALIDACVERARELDADALITVTAAHEIYGRLENGVFRPLEPGQPRRRQLREPLYRESSTVYVTRTAHLLATRSVIGEPLHAIVVEQAQAVDVNDLFDLHRAEALL